MSAGLLTTVTPAADEKMAALSAAGVTVVKSPADIGQAIASRL